MAWAACPEPFGESAYAEDSGPHGADRPEDGPDEDESFDERECGVEGFEAAHPGSAGSSETCTVIPTSRGGLVSLRPRHIEYS